MGAPFGQIMPGVNVFYPPVDRRTRDEVGAIDWHQPQIATTALIESGTKIQYGTVRPTVIGDRVWVMTDVTVSHDVQIGANSEISHGARIGGHVTIGANCRIYMGATIKPRVTIGDGATVGMGAVVTKDVAAGETVVGNPARPLGYRDEWEEWWDNWHPADVGVRGT